MSKRETASIRTPHAGNPFRFLVVEVDAICRKQSRFRWKGKPTRPSERQFVSLCDRTRQSGKRYSRPFVTLCSDRLFDVHRLRADLSMRTQPKARGMLSSCCSRGQRQPRLAQHLSCHPRREAPRQEAHTEARQLVEQARHNRALAAQHRANRGMRHKLRAFGRRVRDPRVVAPTGCSVEGGCLLYTSDAADE